MVLDGVSTPKQSRSRESFARVKAATVTLLSNPDTVDFKLADVSRLSGVSTGSIYTRIQSKSDLLRAVQADEYDRLDAEARTLGEKTTSAATFGDAVRAIVVRHVELLVDNAAILRAFMWLSGGDDELAARGMASNDVVASVFVDALRLACERWGIPVSDDRAMWCYDLTFSVAGRHLGFGLTAGGMPRDPLNAVELCRNLADTVLAYLSCEAIDQSSCREPVLGERPALR